MATDDVSSHTEVCPCGKSTVTFTTSEPDHPWVRASQRTYSAVIDCEQCSKEYIVHQRSSDELPVIVHRKEVDAKKALEDQRRAVEQRIEDSEAGKRLRRRIIKEIDEQPNMAAKHRMLQRLGLAHETYSTYRRRPYDGEQALRWRGGDVLARIGSKTNLGGKDQEYFAGVLAELEKLGSAEQAIQLRVVKLRREVL